MNASKFAAQQKQNYFYKSLTNLLLLPIFSLLNVLSVFTSETYFLFSSYISTQLLLVGYEMQQGTGVTEYAVIFSILAIVAVLPFVACYLVARLVKKPIVSMIATVVGLVLTVADTALLVFDCIVYLTVAPEYFFGNLPDLLVHIVLLGIMIWTTVLSVGLFRDSRRPVAEKEEKPVEVTEGEIAESAAASTRTLTLVRQKRFAAMAMKLIVLKDGEPLCFLGNGETCDVEIPTAKTEIALTFDGASPRMNIPTVILEAGDAPRTLKADIKTGFLYPHLFLTEEN